MSRPTWRCPSCGGEEIAEVNAVAAEYPVTAFDADGQPSEYAAATVLWDSAEPVPGEALVCLSCRATFDQPVRGPQGFRRFVVVVETPRASRDMTPVDADRLQAVLDASTAAEGVQEGLGLMVRPRFIVHAGHPPDVGVMLDPLADPPTPCR